MSQNQSKQFQDVVPPGGRRSIRDIPIPGKNVERGSERISSDIPADVPPTTFRDNFNYDNWEEKPKSSKSKVWYIVSVLVALAAIYGGSTFFHSAKVTYTPRQETITLNNSFTAKGEAAPDQITFDTVTLTESASENIKATGDVQVSRKATGFINIYNSFSTSPQELVKNTRFEAVSGKIYRINENVLVPGMKTVDGKQVPGSIRVLVTANDPGESYNVESSDFTIPGFKGTTKYQGFSAKTDGAISGGFVGKEKAVDEATLRETQTKLESQILASLEQSILSQIPKEFVYIKGSSRIAYRNLPGVAAGEEVKVGVEGTINAYVFKRSDLESAFLKESTAEGASLKDIRIDSYDGVTVTVEDISTSESGDGQTLTFDVKGEVKAFASLNETKLKEEIKGKSKKSILAIISTYSEVESAQISIMPPWFMSLPKDSKDIRVYDTSTQ